VIWLEDKVEIKASPEQIFDWFAHLEENYLAWHPQDHIEWRTLKGNLMEAGSTFYFAERIGERTLRMKCRITGVEPNRRVEWAAIGPFSLLGVGGIFLAEPMAAGSLFTAVVYFGWRVPLLGRVFDWAVRTFLSRRIEALRRHMAEEGQNLKRLLEIQNG